MKKVSFKAFMCGGVALFPLERYNYDTFLFERCPALRPIAQPHPIGRGFPPLLGVSGVLGITTDEQYWVAFVPCGSVKHRRAIIVGYCR